MPKMTLRGTTIRHFDVRRAAQGGALFTRIHLTAAFSEPVRNRMDWEDLPSTYDSAKLDGDLAATHVSLEPNKKEFEKLAIQFDCTAMNAFEAVAVTDKEASSRTVELRFQISTPADVAEKLYAYMTALGPDLASVLNVNYEQQGELELDEKPAKKRAASADGEE